MFDFTGFTLERPKKYTDLNKIGDGNRYGVYRPFQIWHGVAIFGLFV